MTTAQHIYQQAVTRFGPNVRVAELAKVYAGLPDADRRIINQIVLTPPPIAEFATAALLTDAVTKVGPAPADLLRINVYDPRCGLGTTLVGGARQLAATYAARQAGHTPTPDDLTNAVLPYIIMTCVYGMDTDPLAVEVTKLALSLETSHHLQPSALDRNIIRGDPATGGRPPALNHRTNTIDMLTRSSPATR